MALVDVIVQDSPAAHDRPGGRDDARTCGEPRTRDLDSGTQIAERTLPIRADSSTVAGWTPSFVGKEPINHGVHLGLRPLPLHQRESAATDQMVFGVADLPISPLQPEFRSREVGCEIP